MIPISRANSIDTTRSSLEKPISSIIIDFFSSKDLSHKQKLLADFQCKILNDKLSNTPEIDSKIEYYFRNSQNFKDIDQDFLLEMVVNGYNPTDELLNIFRLKNFKFKNLFNPLNQNETHKITLDQYSKRNFNIAILNFDNTQKLIDSIIKSTELYHQDVLSDSKKCKFLFLRMADDYIAFKPAGFMNFINNDSLIISADKKGKMVVLKDYKSFKKLNNSIQIIQNIMDKDFHDSEFAKDLIRTSRDGSQDMNYRNSTELLSDNLQSTSSSTACCSGIFNLFTNLFKRNSKESQDLKPNSSIQNLNDLRSIGRSDIMSER